MTGKWKETLSLWADGNGWMCRSSTHNRVSKVYHIIHSSWKKSENSHLSLPSRKRIQIKDLVFNQGSSPRGQSGEARDFSPPHRSTNKYAGVPEESLHKEPLQRAFTRTGCHRLWLGWMNSLLTVRIWWCRAAGWPSIPEQRSHYPLQRTEDTYLFCQIESDSLFLLLRKVQFYWAR